MSAVKIFSPETFIPQGDDNFRAHLPRNKSFFPRWRSKVHKYVWHNTHTQTLLWLLCLSLSLVNLHKFQFAPIRNSNFANLSSAQPSVISSPLTFRARRTHYSCHSRIKKLSLSEKSWHIVYYVFHSKKARCISGKQLRKFYFRKMCAPRQEIRQSGLWTLHNVDNFQFC